MFPILCYVLSINVHVSKSKVFLLYMCGNFFDSNPDTADVNKRIKRDLVSVVKLLQVITLLYVYEVFTY